VPLRSNFEPGTSRWATRRARGVEIFGRPAPGPDGGVALYDAAR
jgi:hypothetical protein